ncbi:MAG: hypothetical protein ACK2T3_10415, partial [Candidatus Promineifilaceae bacterium]
MPSPFYLVIAPLLLSFVAYAIRRWMRLTALVGVGVLILLSAILSAIDLNVVSAGGGSGLVQGNSWILLGREVALNEAVKTILLFLYASFGMIFLFSIAQPQEAGFVPLSLAVLSPLSAVLMVRPEVFGAILLLIAAGILTIIIQGRRPGSTLAAFRYFSMIAIAAPMLLIAGWITETEQTPLVGSLITLYMVAFAILLIGFPFQIWVAPLMSRAKSLVPSVVLGLAQIVTIAFCLILLQESPAIRASAQFWRVLQASGSILLILAILFCLSSKSFGRLLGYLVLINIAIVVVSFSYLNRTTPELVMIQLIARVPGLLLAGMGYGMLRYQLGSGIGVLDISESANRLAWKTPVSLAMFIYGGLILLGLPLTIGFPGRWMAIEIASKDSVWTAALIVLAVAAGTAKLIQVLAKALSKDAPAVEIHRELTRELKIAAAAA